MGELTSGNPVIYSCATTAPRAKLQSAIYTYDLFLWVRSQGTACLMLSQVPQAAVKLSTWLSFPSPTHVAADSIQFFATG